MSVPQDDAILDEIVATFSFRRLPDRRQHKCGGTWVKGRAAGMKFEALVFREHADDPSFEIERSRISKLWITDVAVPGRFGDATVYHWDRGLDTPPRDR